MYGFKLATTKATNELRGTPRVPVWQRNYDEHVLRNDADLARVRDTIEKKTPALGRGQ
jgi:REP-associated tyrosine transposase